MVSIVVKKSTIELSYPYDSPTISVTLPAPLFENSETLLQKRILRKTIGLTNKNYRDSNWPQYYSLFMICDACTDTQRDDFFTFLETAFGLEIRLVDHETRTWRGLIIPGEVTETRQSCGHVIQFEFQGYESS